MNDGESTWTEILVGPRFAKLPKFVRDECWTRKLKLEIEVDKGWIRESVRIKVTGPTAVVERFRNDVYGAMEAYNATGRRSAAVSKDGESR